MGHHGESVSDLAISLKVALDQKEIENMKKDACNYYIYNLHDTFWRNKLFVQNVLVPLMSLLKIHVF